MTDAINNGADDDACGSIAVLELAEAIMRGLRGDAIVFAWFGGEESGGAGSP